MIKYELTEEHRKELKPWADKWIANAMSTTPMSEDDKIICRQSVKEMYLAANLTPPPDHRIVFVPSPFVLKFAGGFAAALWYLKKNTQLNNDNATSDAVRDATDYAVRDATDYAVSDAVSDATSNAVSDATDYATSDAVRDATSNAVRDATSNAVVYAVRDATSNAVRDATSNAVVYATDYATSDAVRDATSNAVRDATSDAVRDAVRDATSNAVRDATSNAVVYATDYATSDAVRDATSNAVRDATSNATWYKFNTKVMVSISNSLGLGIFGLNCANKTWRMYTGGNQWSGWLPYISFFRYISKLDLDYSKWDSYEKLGLHSGPRIMHEEFCMICDRPLILKVNSLNQAHCSDGPFCVWSDGSVLYSMNGIRVPAWVAETTPEKFTKEMILNEKNADVRREIIRKIGMERVSVLLDYTVIDLLDDYELITFDMGDGRIRPFLKMINPSLENVVHIEGVRPGITTVKDAICYRNTLATFEKPSSLS